MRLLKIGLLSAACGLTLAAASVSAQPPREGDRPAGQRGDRPQGDRPQGDRPQGDRPEGDRPQGERGGRGFGGGFGGPGGPGGGRVVMSEERRVGIECSDGWSAYL